jgi:hypothetical protein
MRRLRSVLIVVSVLAILLALVAASGTVASPSTTSSTPTPRWVLHVQRHSGGISNGVRAALSDQVASAGPELDGSGCRFGRGGGRAPQRADE